MKKRNRIPNYTTTTTVSVQFTNGPQGGKIHTFKRIHGKRVDHKQINKIIKSLGSLLLLPMPPNEENAVIFEFKITNTELL